MCSLATTWNCLLCTFGRSRTIENGLSDRERLETKLPDLQQLVTHKDDKLESLHEKAEQAENQMPTARCEKEHNALGVKALGKEMEDTCSVLSSGVAKVGPGRA